LRAECLNASWFLSMADARDRIEVCLRWGPRWWGLDGRDR
jgi:hypothetical protein